jgi:hypothetical protein
MLTIFACRGADIDYQRSENALATALGYITRWHSFWDPRVLMHPLRPFIQRYFGYVLNRLIQKELDQRSLELQEEISQTPATREVTQSGAKSVVT